MNLTIRRLETEDWPLFREVRLAALQDAPEAFATTYRDVVDRDETFWREATELPCWLAFDEDDPVGMVRTGHSDGKLPHLLSMWVAPAARGSMAGRLLVRAAVDWARETGAAGIGLRVVTGNERARTFYQRCGFEETGASFTLPDGRPEIEMVHPFRRP